MVYRHPFSPGVLCCYRKQLLQKLPGGIIVNQMVRQYANGYLRTFYHFNEFVYKLLHRATTSRTSPVDDIDMGVHNSYRA